MNPYIFINLFCNLWCLVSAADAVTNLLDLQLLGVEFKENFYEIKDHGLFLNVDVMNINNKIQESKTHTKYYNQSIILNMLCYGRNITENHILTWHHYIGDTEIGRVSLGTSEPNNNYTLSLLMRSYDNQSTIYCTASDSLTNEIINRTDDLKFQMNDFLNEDLATIATCQGNYSEGSTEPCAIGSRYNRAVQVTQRINKEYTSVYETIQPVYYNENFPIITHRCSRADRSIIKTSDGSARINTNVTLRLDRSDNGTIIYCSRYKNVVHKFRINNNDNENKVKRETYNERIYIYNELYWKDAYSQNGYKAVNVITILITIGGIVLATAIGFNIMLCVYPRIRKHRNTGQGTSNKI